MTQINQRSYNKQNSKLGYTRGMGISKTVYEYLNTVREWEDFVVDRSIGVFNLTPGLGLLCIHCALK